MNISNICNHEEYIKNINESEVEVKKTLTQFSFIKNIQEISLSQFLALIKFTLENKNISH